MQDIDSAVRGTRRRIAAVLALRRLLVDEGRWFLLWGLGALVSRVLGGSARWAFLLGLAGAGLIAISAIERGIRSAPPVRSLLALFDVRMHAGGLAAASADVSLGAWTLPPAAPPPVRWDARRPLLLLVGAAAFVAGAHLIPIRSAASRRPLELGADAKRIEGKIEVLEQEKILTPDRAEALKQTVEELKATAEGDDPAKAWEMLDAVEDSVSKSAASAAEEAIRNGEALAQIAAMSSMPDMANAVRQASENPSLMPGVDAKSATMAQLGAAAQRGQASLRDKLAKMAAKGMIDPKSLNKFDSATSQAARDELAEYLRNHKGQSQQGQMARGGRGGVDRGRGDAPLFFGEETKSADEKFRDMPIPPAAEAALEQSDVIGQSAAEPDKTLQQRSRGGALAAGTGSGSAWRTTILPRHRGSVARYFERSK